MQKIITLFLILAMVACGGASASGVSSPGTYNPAAVAITGGTITGVLGGAPPSATTCGTSPIVVGNSAAFKLTVGYPFGAGYCSLTFPTPAPVAWVCTANIGAYIGANMAVSAYSSGTSVVRIGVYNVTTGNIADAASLEFVVVCAPR